MGTQKSSTTASYVTVKVIALSMVDVAIYYMNKTISLYVCLCDILQKYNVLAPAKLQEPLSSVNEPSGGRGAY